ncbi:hypothetical protein, partial [Bradyrhizobium jicamae]|uniref:hypothetical protein n=1 Tax=Bradyrhizobium jicamae TaxID=280332 RepID=UPI001BAAAA92
LGGFRTPAAEQAATSLKRPASETLHNSGARVPDSGHDRTNAMTAIRLYRRDGRSDPINLYTILWEPTRDVKWLAAC